MDIFDVAKELMPAGPILIVFGITWGIRWSMTRPRPDGIISPLPSWFIFIPIGLGVFTGFLYYFKMADPAVLSALPLWKKLTDAFWQGILFGAGAVVTWEVVYRFFLKKLEGPTP
jgi:hypothetical protein